MATLYFSACDIVLMLLSCSDPWHGPTFSANLLMLYTLLLYRTGAKGNADNSEEDNDNIECCDACQDLLDFTSVVHIFSHNLEVTIFFSMHAVT